MVKVSPQHFQRAFLRSVEPLECELVNVWDSPKVFTDCMRDKVFPQIGQILRLQTYNRDYYTLDSILYEEKDIEHFSPNNTYAKYIAVAIEHENNVDTSYVEVNKLQLFNVPLKVLITYAKNIERYLCEYRKILELADVFRDFATLRRQLVIFGYIHEHHPVWRFFVYEADGFSELKSDSLG